MQTFEYEYTDTFGGEANYCWVKRGKVRVHDLTTYGYNGAQGFTKADKRQAAHVMRLAKAELGLSGIRGNRESWCGTEIFRPYSMNTILFVNYCEE